MSDPDAELLEIFRDEANERLDNMVQNLLALERGAAGPEAVNALFRDAHTIKGGAGMLGLEDTRTLAHAVEDVLADARDAAEFPAALTEPLLRALDGLRKLVAGNANGTAGLLDELTATRETLTAHAPSTPPAAEVEPRPAEPGPERRTVRVPAEKIDLLLDLVGETVLHRRRLEHTLGEQPRERQEVADELGLGERLFDELKDAAIGMRTLPLASIVATFPRAVRDLAQAAGKDVELVLIGVETELDRVILESLPDPIVHLLRNAIAHGIETPEERRRAGKPDRGRIELRAEQRGGQVEIAIADDGRGVEESLLREARREGSLTDVLAKAGRTTAAGVSDLAGRGVGLDAVKTQIETVGGSIEVESEPGRGTRVVLRLPLTLALLDVLLCERGGNVYGIPLPAVEEGISVDDTLSLEGKQSIRVRGEAVPLVDLADVLGAEAPPLRAQPPALVVGAGGRRVAVATDLLIGEQEVVVKPLGSLLAGLRRYLGAAILGDGRIALLLDPSSLTRTTAEAAAAIRDVEPSENAVPKVLVVEDSLAVRELQRSILETAGYQVVTAGDGREALTRLDADQAISLVVTDVEMPEMDGLELTKTIRSSDHRSALPIVIVTTRGEDEDRRRGIEAGADAYMVKRDFDQNALLATVERLVGR